MSISPHALQQHYSCYTTIIVHMNKTNCIDFSPQMSLTVQLYLGAEHTRQSGLPSWAYWMVDTW